MITLWKKWRGSSRVPVKCWLLYQLSQRASHTGGGCRWMVHKQVRQHARKPLAGTEKGKEDQCQSGCLGWLRGAPGWRRHTSPRPSHHPTVRICLTSLPGFSFSCKLSNLYRMISLLPWSATMNGMISSNLFTEDSSLANAAKCH